MKIKRKIVLVKWEDSILGYAGWKIIENEPKRKSIFHSIGFLIKEDKDYITIYGDIEKTKNKQSGARDIMIPKSAIRKMQYL